jgi:hypothetical protein
MKKYFLTICFVVIFFNTLYSQSNYLGYNEACLNKQKEIIINTIHNTINSQRFEKFDDSVFFDVVIEIDSNGYVNKFKIIYNDFFTKNEIKRIRKKIKHTVFYLCHDDSDLKNYNNKKAFLSSSSTGLFNYRLKIHPKNKN